MAKLAGIFDLFPDLDKIPKEDIYLFLQSKIEIHTLENTIGNKILYPQSVPVTKEDLNLDLSILKAALKNYPHAFYNPKSTQILIPESFIGRYPTLSTVALAFVEAVHPPGVLTIFVKSKGKNIQLGTVITLALNTKDQKVLSLLNKKMITLISGTINQVAFKESSGTLKIDSQPEMSIQGGEIGIIIDLR